MIELKRLIIEIKKSEIISLMKKYFDDCSRKYFKDEQGKYTYPKFEVRPNIKYAGAYSPQKNRFILNLDFAQNKNTLKSTMYHETIHYYQTHAGLNFSKMVFKLHGYHDDYFKEKMKQINAGEGENLVTIIGTYQSIKGGKATKPFWVYVLQRGKEYLMAWSPTKNENFIARLKRLFDYYKYDDGFLVQTDTIIFKENPRAKGGGRSVPMGSVKPGDKYYDEISKEFKTAKKEKL